MVELRRQEQEDEAVAGGWRQKKHPPNTQRLLIFFQLSCIGVCSVVGIILLKKSNDADK
jgi:hypothetical protein